MTLFVDPTVVAKVRVQAKKNKVMSQQWYLDIKCEGDEKLLSLSKEVKHFLILRHLMTFMR